MLKHPKPIVTIDVEPMEINLVGGESQTLTIDVKVDGVSGGEYTITTEDTDKLTIDGDTITANVDVEDGSASVVITSIDNDEVSVVIPIQLQGLFFEWIDKPITQPSEGKYVIEPSFRTNYSFQIQSEYNNVTITQSATVDNVTRVRIMGTSAPVSTYDVIVDIKSTNGVLLGQMKCTMTVGGYLFSQRYTP